MDRTLSIFAQHKKMEDEGNGKPWFTYLSFQSVHDPLQVPHIYKKNVCPYKDSSRYFYSAMVSSLDHSVDRVVQGLKATGFYENTIIAFTTDNGNAMSAHAVRERGVTCYHRWSRQHGGKQLASQGN